MTDPFTTATGYAAAGGIGGGVGAASMLPFMKPKTAWAGVAQICMGITWGTFGGKTAVDVFSHLPVVGGSVDTASLFHVTFCGVLIGCLVYTFVGSLARYLIRLEHNQADIFDIARDISEMKNTTPPLHEDRRQTHRRPRHRASQGNTNDKT